MKKNFQNFEIYVFSKIYKLRKIYISKNFKIIFENFEIHISKFLFRKKFKLFSKIWKYISFEIKTDFFFRKRSFLNFLNKKNL